MIDTNDKSLQGPRKEIRITLFECGAKCPYYKWYDACGVTASWYQCVEYGAQVKPGMPGFWPFPEWCPLKEINNV